MKSKQNELLLYTLHNMAVEFTRGQKESKAWSVTCFLKKLDNFMTVNNICSNTC